MGSMAQSNMMVSASLMLALLPLTGCGATSDPSQGGFLGGVQGLVSGGYDQRITQRKAALGNLQIGNQILEQDNRQLDKEAGGVASERHRLHQQIATLDAKTTELTARTSRLRADTETERRQRADLDQRLRQVRDDLAALNREADGNRMTAEAAERQRRELEQELADLSVVADALQ
jgi:chromosome segregation ATPase